MLRWPATHRGIRGTQVRGVLRQPAGASLQVARYFFIRSGPGSFSFTAAFSQDGGHARTGSSRCPQLPDLPIKFLFPKHLSSRQGLAKIAWLQTVSYLKRRTSVLIHSDRNAKQHQMLPGILCPNKQGLPHDQPPYTIYISQKYGKRHGILMGISISLSFLTRRPYSL